MVTFPQLLFAIASVTPVVAGFVEGQKAGFIGRLIGFMVGLAIGSGWFFGLFALTRLVLRGHFARKPSTFLAEAKVTLFYVFVLASGFGTAAVAIYLTRFVTRHVSA